MERLSKSTHPDVLPAMEMEPKRVISVQETDNVPSAVEKETSAAPTVTAQERQQSLTSEKELWESLGFRLNKFKTRASRGRRVFTQGKMSVLTPDTVNPWTTVQWLSNTKTVDWFIDFPLDVDVECIICFIDKLFSVRG